MAPRWPPVFSKQQYICLAQDLEASGDHFSNSDFQLLQRSTRYGTYIHVLFQDQCNYEKLPYHELILNSWVGLVI